MSWKTASESPSDKDRSTNSVAGGEYGIWSQRRVGGSRGNSHSTGRPITDWPQLDKLPRIRFRRYLTGMGRRTSRSPSRHH